jgi:hypothetical protein
LSDPEARPARLQRALAALVLGALLAIAARQALAQAPPAAAPALPSWVELEAQGARIGEIRVVPEDIFDLRDAQEDNALFRLANALHFKTRPQVIRSALLFASGDRLSAAVIDETERLLRRNNYLHDVLIRPTAWQDGVVDIEVRTRDTWSLDLGISASRAGGANSSRVRLKEYNLLGTGIALSIGRTNTVDRSGNEIEIAADRLAGTWAQASYTVANNDDGRRDAVSLVRPFYALDARWAAGFSASRDDRIDAIYDAGRIASEYRHQDRRAEAFIGWSAGRVDGWVQRWSVGLLLADDAFAAEPERVAPLALPRDQQLRAPFVRYELLEDRFERATNRNVMGRPEFLPVGLMASVQLGWAGTALGSSRDTLLYAGSVSRGFHPSPGHTVIGSATVSGEFAEGQASRQRVGARVESFVQQGEHWLFYGSVLAERLTRPNPADTLLLGGDSGLRGYPLRYQSGLRKVLATAERRYYTDIYAWRLFRLGAAAFVDVGRAWDSYAPTQARTGWLADVGLGLRIVNTRTAYGNVLHLDVAVPLNASPDIRKLQFLVKTKTSF